MPRADLVPDCAACAALCCVALTFDASPAFAFDKPAGVACRYLTSGCRCAIHDRLVERGFSGCASYDCYGAGQRATRSVTISERDQAFLALRAVHEMLWYLTEALPRCPAEAVDLRAAIQAQIQALDALAAAVVEGRANTGLGAFERVTRALMRRLGEAISRPR